MSLLIINTLEESSPAAQMVISRLTEKTPVYQIFHTQNMKISPCTGCNACWLRTPGICVWKDDQEQILKACLQYDTTIFISDTSLGFLNYKTKHVIDRMLPLVTMYTRIEDGQMRHVPRYDKRYRFGLLYTGHGDKPYLERWLERFALNFNGISLGVYPAIKCEEVISCI